MAVVYTTYLSNYKKIPDNTKKIFMEEITPYGFSIEENNIEQIVELSPDEALIANYKSGKSSLPTMHRLYKRQLKRGTARHAILDNIEKEYLSNGQDVCFIAYERSVDSCFRGLIGDFYQKKGYDYIELPLRKW